MHAIKIPQILLPKNADMHLWAVNACDQFTSDENYWKELDGLVGDNPSALRLIYPEIYLKDNPEKRIAEINANMHNYLNGGVFEKVEGGFVLVERTTQSGTRTGIVLAVDLEDYDFSKGSKALIRSTEATILERIPPRVKIRENAPVELPHVMLLYDDPENSVLKSAERGKVLYDFDMNMGGGHVKGTYISNADAVTEAFYALVGGDKYGNGEKLLFAVGDGNHSLATAKTCWENIKKTLSPEQAATHPARFALVEAVNIYDGALTFEPIHRLVKTGQPEKFVKGLKTNGGKNAYIAVNGEVSEIAFADDVPQGIRQLDGYSSDFIKLNGGEVDYIHGDNELKNFSSQGVGIILPSIEKGDFFRLIVTGGNLPRKTFSMGGGNEKRYYIEAKSIANQG
ncbi:MAG: DUF1015 domain-containing protein [Clostridia bacterium]|nr:DUF1015 domain-containing protein [Clostridia bacterium]